MIVKEQGDSIAGAQTAGVGEGIIDDHFVQAIFREVTPSPHVNVVEHRGAFIRHADHQT